MRLPQGTSRAKKAICESMVDYSQSKIFNSFEHVNSLEEIASKKEKIYLEKEESARLRALAKAKRAQKKLRNMVAKNARQRNPKIIQ